jgi:hypothetical protein
MCRPIPELFLEVELRVTLEQSSACCHKVGEGDAERNCCKVCRPFYPAAGTEGGGHITWCGWGHVGAGFEVANVVPGLRMIQFFFQVSLQFVFFSILSKIFGFFNPKNI